MCGVVGCHCLVVLRRASRHNAEQDSDYLQLHTTHTDRTTLLQTNLLTKCAFLPVAIYSTCTPDDGWDCHPKRRVKAFAKNKTQLLHLVGIIFTTRDFLVSVHKFFLASHSLGIRLTVLT